MHLWNLTNLKVLRVTWHARDPGEPKSSKCFLRICRQKKSWCQAPQQSGGRILSELSVVKMALNINDHTCEIKIIGELNQLFLVVTLSVGMLVSVSVLSSLQSFVKDFHLVYIISKYGGNMSDFIFGIKSKFVMQYSSTWTYHNLYSIFFFSYERNKGILGKETAQTEVYRQRHDVEGAWALWADWLIRGQECCWAYGKKTCQAKCSWEESMENWKIWLNWGTVGKNDMGWSESSWGMCNRQGFPDLKVL